MMNQIALVIGGDSLRCINKERKSRGTKCGLGGIKQFDLTALGERGRVSLKQIAQGLV